MKKIILAMVVAAGMVCAFEANAGLFKATTVAVSEPTLEASDFEAMSVKEFSALTTKVESKTTRLALFKKFNNFLLNKIENEKGVKRTLLKVVQAPVGLLAKCESAVHTLWTRTIVPALRKAFEGFRDLFD